MAKATFPAQSQSIAESVKPADGDGFTPSDHRNAYSAVYQGDLSPLRPRAKSPAALAINIAATEIEGFFRNLYWNGDHVKFAGGDSPNFTAPVANPRIDLLVLDVSGGPTGVLTRIAGTEAASPAEPALPNLKTNIPICYVYNRVGQTKIVNFEDSGANPAEGYIYRDVRPWVPPGGSTTLGGTPTTSTVGDAAAEGAGANAAKTDHRHGRESAGTPVVQDFGDLAAQGSGPAISYSNHRHGMPVKPSGGYTNLQVFTANGTWVKPAGVSKVFIEVWGGGGGGGGSTAGSGNNTANSSGAGGGGAGGYCGAVLTVSGDVSVTVGASGSGGGTGGAGANGGNSNFGAVTANGGVGGSAGQQGSSNGPPGGNGGTGGTGSGGDHNITGADGTSGTPGGTTSNGGACGAGGSGGVGGTSGAGGGGGGGGTGGNGMAGQTSGGGGVGSPGRAPGGGGGGAGAPGGFQGLGGTSGAAATGGAGGAGRVVVYWNE